MGSVSQSAEFVQTDMFWQTHVGKVQISRPLTSQLSSALDSQVPSASMTDPLR